MPGLLGIISKTSAGDNKAHLSRMLDSMSHEAFYSKGTYFDEHLGVYVGWIAHKNSFCDCMPIWNENKKIALFFFGENYTNKDLFEQLKEKNHDFDQANASYLIHMYEEQGIDFVNNLNGLFTGLLIDYQTNQIYLFNDRYGMQKIFYHHSKEAFYFASEAKALFRVSKKLRELDFRGLGELISCECVLENRSLYKHILLLPAGSSWLFQGNEIKKTYYFNPATWENQESIEKELFYEKLRNTFVTILPRYFRGSQPIGISMTGGLDTRMLMANIHLSPGKYPYYTFASMYRECNDHIIAREAAKIMRQTFTAIPVNYTFLNKFNLYAEKTVYISDGYVDVSIAPEVFVNNIARKIAPVRMTGNMGSEVLRNIRWLKLSKYHENIFHSDFKPYLNQSSETLHQISLDTLNPLTFTLFIETPWWGNNRLVMEQSQLTLRTPYLDNDIVSLMYQAPEGVRNSKELSFRLIEDGNISLSMIPTDRGLGGTYKFPFSFFLHQFQEFLFKAEYAYDYGMPQWLACFDYVFKFMHFEKIFLGQHKFAHFRLWYRDALADYIKSILLDEKSLKRHYLNRKFVEFIVESHTKGYRNYTTEITKLLTVELIQRLLVESDNHDSNNF